MKSLPVYADLRTTNGDVLQLAPLRSWEIMRTNGEDGCDAIRFVTQPDYNAAQLERVNNLRAFCGGSLVFTGYVDELACGVSRQGSALTVCGRGNAARLLDNQVTSEVFRKLTTGELLRRYVHPLGVSVSETAPASVARFAVSCGNSVMQVVQGFCVHAGLKPPMFDTRGGMLLRAAYPNTNVLFDATNVRAATYHDCRYGVLSRMELRHTRTGQKQVATYPAFSARGGLCRHYGMYSGTDIPATWRTADQRVAQARNGEFTLELTVDDQFPCLPGTMVTVLLPKLGVEGQFCVRAVRSVGNEQGCCAIVSLRREG